MSFSDDFLKLLFQNLAIANVGDASGIQPSAASGNLYLRLCTDAEIVDNATLGTECTYTGYVAKGIAVPRTADDWSVDSGQVVNLNEIIFGACTAGDENIRYVEIWKNNSDTTENYRVAWVKLEDDLIVTSGVTPKFSIGALTFTFE